MQLQINFHRNNSELNQVTIMNEYHLLLLILKMFKFKKTELLVFKIIDKIYLHPQQGKKVVTGYYIRDEFDSLYIIDICEFNDIRHILRFNHNLMTFHQRKKNKLIVGLIDIKSDEAVF